MATNLESITKVVTALVAAGGLIVTGMTFAANQRLEIATRHLQARQPFLQEQLKLYTEATKVTSRLANETAGDPAVEAARKRFWELYWGELALVEDRDVERAIVAMGKCLNGDCGPCGTLRQCALQVAHACRRSLANSWGVRDWIKDSNAAP
ncbi:MAG: hypothetical protein FJX78_00510 [Armatimonadetes bacterium]|nr:hypothetical protein [Armatimonadota bacterium]